MVSIPPVLIGALVPLTPPGWVEAGRNLLAGLELAVADVNGVGGIAGRPLELVVRDTAADPERAAAAVDELADLGVAAVAGEYHSVVARAAAARADALRLPFLCSSAVLDKLTDQPTDWVARIAPPQSRGWRTYADFLRGAGHTRVAVVSQPSVYWATGTAILREHLSITEVGVDSVCDDLAASDATALLLLVGHPDPALPIATAVRADPRHAGILIGAPAGQPEFAEWKAMPGIPFLRYLPESLTAVGERVASRLPASFVAYEGYDSVLVLAECLRENTWQVTVEGTRGRLEFARGPSVWQWTRPPIQIADRDPADPSRFRVLHTG